MCSFINQVGTGSSEHDFKGLLLTSRLTSSSLEAKKCWVYHLIIIILDSHLEAHSWGLEAGVSEADDNSRNTKLVRAQIME